MCNAYTVDLINNNISRDVQEECANRLYRVYTHLIINRKGHFVELLARLHGSLLL